MTASMAMKWQSVLQLLRWHHYEDQLLDEVPSAGAVAEIHIRLRLGPLDVSSNPLRKGAQGTNSHTSNNTSRPRETLQ